MPETARGYFAIGVEGVPKAVNLGNLLRSAHAFGASFAFTIGADARAMETLADTSKAPRPFASLSLAKRRGA
ncbi:MAG: hypothetical protein WB662_10360 [Methyloceanibacter sp.]